MIELVICNSDTMDEGAIRALQTYGYNLGTDDSIKIPVFGVDASIPGRQLIAENKMTGTVVQDAGAMAECILHLSKNVAEKKDMLAGTEKYSWDKEHDLRNKFYMHYSLYDPSVKPLTPAADTDISGSAASDSSASESVSD
jgi:methyl-galactoside transport system substrate-binding protein